MNSEPDQERARLLRLATIASVSTATVLIAMKLLAYIATGSVSILASLVDSLMDGAASALNLVAVRYATAPPDEAHRFGHGKAEGIAALGQATFIAGSGVFLCIEAVSRLLDPQPIAHAWPGVVVMLLSIVLTLALLALQHYVVRRTNSRAIRADALHYRADLLSNAGIIGALVLAERGWPGFDPLFALAIAAYILHSAWTIGRGALDELLDRELPESQRSRLLELARAHPAVRGVHDLRSRVSGGTVIIQLHLELDGGQTLLQAHSVVDEVHASIEDAFPGADIVIHQDPV